MLVTKYSLYTGQFCPILNNEINPIGIIYLLDIKPYIEKFDAVRNSISGWLKASDEEIRKNALMRDSDNDKNARSLRTLLMAGVSEQGSAVNALKLNVDQSNGWESIANSFIANRNSIIGVKTLETWLKSLAPGGTVLDIGCGFGVPNYFDFIKKGV